ncbi:unnamed protein product [Rotaria magnacalcarata]|uniref:Uncharacterized protein n=1 Tax=Rotaria magnacalcarata TaxID=392030 RepID=A0A816GX23_9BILA|nr:unnamed protein product [Rotaria magnacalcarata]CAF2065716.1 unnamed protein product [Rotaria magnacalcarata]CAF4754889.1 unnamed protein product [Rotaria magnacalcarata]CAF5091756.1 unnamed protein product [Rotaria magnacalcarata]
MHILLLIIFAGFSFLPHNSPLFTGSATTILNYLSLNLTYSQQIDTLYNGTITYQYAGNSTNAYYCIVSVIASLQNNLTQTVTSRFTESYWNLYRNFAINHCGFSTAMDIGYGNCTPYYFQTATSIQFCVCSTNNCSDTYSSCQASVNQASTSPTPSMPVLQPTLSSIITCQDAYVNLSVSMNITPPMYLGCGFMNNFGDPDFSRCSYYSPNRTVICGVFYTPLQGSFQQVAMIEGGYELLILDIIEAAAFSSNISSGIYLYQTSTSVATLTPVSSEPYYGGFCFCITNNCNADFATCTQGMNISSYLLAYNGSTSSTSSVSTGSSSGGTTVSSSSTIVVTTRTVSTTSSSSSIITSLLSSTVTQMTTSITVSSTGTQIFRYQMQWIFLYWSAFNRYL